MVSRETVSGERIFGGMSFGGWRRTMLGLLCGVALALAMTAVLANPAKADTFTVTKTADTSDGTCDADCSLREAMGAANATTQDDNITFASGVSGEITLSNGQLRVESAGGALSIEGPGADQLAVDGAGSSRVFLVTRGAEASIAGLTVRDGKNVGSDGGGIYNDGTLTVNNSTVSGNSSVIRGGGIFNSSSGTLTLNNSTVSGNSAEDLGGGIRSLTVSVNSTTPNPAQRTTIRNSTISGNEALVRGGGGGVMNLPGFYGDSFI